MNYKNYVPKSEICNFKAHAFPQNILSLTTSQEDRKNSERNQEKSDLQKYLNVYESIEKRELLINDRKKTDNKIFQVKKYINHNKGIFQNPFIQNSCSQICDQKRNTVTQPNYQILIESKNGKKKFLQKNILAPNKKNEMSLKMIAQHKFFDYRQEFLQNKEDKPLIEGSQQTDQKNKYFEIHPLSFENSSYLQKTNYQTKDKNIFGITSLQKPYKSYYQSKYQKQYPRSSQSKLRNSQNFLFQVDRFIQNQKNRQQIIRPRTSNLINTSFKKSLHFMNNFVDENRPSTIQIQKQPKRVQSQAKFLHTKNSKDKTQNEMLNNKTKKYFFHKKYHQPLRSFSFHPDNQKQNHKKFCPLSITTETPLTKSIFLTSKQQNLNQSIKIANSTHPKKTLLKKCLINGKMTELYQEKSQKNTLTCDDRIQRQSHRNTLNKIQESIANDVQISIRHLDTKY